MKWVCMLLLVFVSLSMSQAVGLAKDKPGGHGSDGRENCPHVRGEGAGGITGEPRGREERESCVAVLRFQAQYPAWMVQHCKFILDAR